MASLRQSIRASSSRALMPAAFTPRSPDPPVLHRTYQIDRRVRLVLEPGDISGPFNVSPKLIADLIPVPGIQSMLVHQIEAYGSTLGRLTVVHVPTGVQSEDVGTEFSARPAAGIRLPPPHAGPFLPSSEDALFTVILGTTPATDTVVDFNVTFVTNFANILPPSMLKPTVSTEFVTLSI